MSGYCLFHRILTVLKNFEKVFAEKCTAYPSAFQLWQLSAFFSSWPRLSTKRHPPRTVVSGPSGLMKTPETHDSCVRGRSIESRTIESQRWDGNLLRSRVRHLLAKSLVLRTLSRGRQVGPKPPHEEAPVPLASFRGAGAKLHRECER